VHYRIQGSADLASRIGIDSELAARRLDAQPAFGAGAQPCEHALMRQASRWPPTRRSLVESRVLAARTASIADRLAGAAEPLDAVVHARVFEALRVPRDVHEVTIEIGNTYLVSKWPSTRVR